MSSRKFSTKYRSEFCRDSTLGLHTSSVLTGGGCNNIFAAVGWVNGTAFTRKEAMCGL